MSTSSNTVGIHPSMREAAGWWIFSRKNVIRMPNAHVNMTAKNFLISLII